LVAGGEDPIHDTGEEARVLHANGESYDPVTKRFDLDFVTLREERTRHAATVLPSGESLLVGGRSVFDTALQSLEAVSPETRTGSFGGLKPLDFARIEPTVLRLTDGSLFVGGGYDDAGHPVSALEWLTDDASAGIRTTDDLPARFDRAFVAMPGGAVLAVGGCEDRSPEPGEVCSKTCLRGCPPRPDPDGDSPMSEAFWIDKNGYASEVELDVPAPRALLLPGSDGSPWLFVTSVNDDGSLAPEAPRLFRFNPFRARFEPSQVSPGEMPPLLGPTPLALAPDHFLWFSGDDPPAVVGFRGGNRNRYSDDVGLVVTSQPEDPLWPSHLVPSRAPDGVHYDGKLSFEASSEDPIAVYVADALFDDVDIELAVEMAPPLVLFGDRRVGDATCPWPGPDPDGSETLYVERRGSDISLSRAGERTTCKLDPGAVSIGLGATTSVSSVALFEIRRR
jgi:hypothetical protein